MRPHHSPVALHNFYIRHARQLRRVLAFGAQIGARRPPRRVLGQVARFGGDDEPTRQLTEHAQAAVAQSHVRARERQPMLDKGRRTDGAALLVEHSHNSSVAHEDLVVKRRPRRVFVEGTALGVVQVKIAARQVEHIDGDLVAQVRKVELHNIVR
eukprot:scaffold12211_cov116-Isochrysis_galbana.AAC.3